jgi:hypothetical protein
VFRIWSFFSASMPLTGIILHNVTHHTRDFWDSFRLYLASGAHFSAFDVTTILVISSLISLIAANTS